MSNPTEELVGKISDQRFDGYTVTMLAEQVEAIRSGAGIAGIGAAVDALQSVATAFDETENILREQLAELGVAWSSEAAQQATTVFADHAAFAGDTNTKLVETAEAGFTLGEAFTRTLHRLPDAQILRDGAGGLGFGDYLGSLVGYETDQAERVKAAQLAQSQAVDALNAYAGDTGAALRSIQPLLDPGSFVLGGTPSGQERSHGTAESSTFGSIGSTVAALAGPDPTPGMDKSAASGPIGGLRSGSADCEPSSSGFAAAPAPQRRAASPAAPPDGGQGSSAPQGASPSSGAVGGGVIGGGATPSGTTPRSGQPPAPGVPDPGGPVADAPSGDTTPTKPGSTGGRSGGPAVDPGMVRGPIEQGGRPGSAVAFPGGAGAPGGASGKAVPLGGSGAGSAEQPLAKGKLTGAVPPPAVTAGAPELGAGFGAQPRQAVSGDLAAGAAALGAAGVAAADVGRERRGGGFGRGVQVDGRPLHEFPVGVADKAAEREAANVELIEPPVGPDEPAFLQQAAPQRGNIGRVRSHGIDDVDLFADERMVARGTLDGNSEPGGAAS